MNADELREVLSAHSRWVVGDAGGQRADLHGADLFKANLFEANLHGADLFEANLRGADLRGADLRDTVLDPARPASGATDAFERDGDYVIGYRSRYSTHVGDTDYAPGTRHEAPVFSTCPDTSCHPGLYLWPTLKEAIAWHDGPTVKVRALARDVHRGGDKWRCRAFDVIEEAGT